MPAVSKAQFKKIGVLMKAGKISRSKGREFLKGVDFDSLPDRKAKAKKKWSMKKRGK